mmetsp:Transcript_15089/g.21829  ORF Transcript_15089/g.21829 Transcript_15089/m.21829 type:complete len:261 (+) Transcript_15089:87-869(+)
MSTTLHSGYTFWYMRRGKGSNNNNNNNNNNAAAATSTNTSSTVTVASPVSSPSLTSTATPEADESKAAHTYENSIKNISTVVTVEDFWNIYNYLVRPNDLPTTTDYHFFRQGVKPTWEDSANVRGGKWIVRLRKGLASRYWEELLLALIGGQFQGIPEGEICGCVVSIRYSEDILGIWNKTANDRELTERLREAIKKILQLPPHAPMEYKPHHTSLQDKSSFRNTQVWKPKSEKETRRSGSWSERDSGRSKTRDSDRAWR